VRKIFSISYYCSWPEQFNHVDLALQLLDKSSMGKNIESFRNTKNMLSKVLRGSVDSVLSFFNGGCFCTDIIPEHYQAFAASLPLHASLITHLNAVQNEVLSTRSALHEAKECLGGVRADLVRVWSRGQVLEEMIKILDQMQAHH
jgi:exocyst complex component 4